MSGSLYLWDGSLLKVGEKLAVHERCCCAFWQGRVMYEAAGTCVDGVWDKIWEVVLDEEDNPVYQCLYPPPSEPEIPAGTIEPISGNLRCDDEYFEIGSIVWVYGYVHADSEDCNYENAREGAAAPDPDDITGKVWDHYAWYFWSGQEESDPVECPEPDYIGTLSWDRWDCEPREEKEFDTGCVNYQDPTPPHHYEASHERLEFTGTFCGSS